MTRLLDEGYTVLDILCRSWFVFSLLGKFVICFGWLW
jgi:hypothetical protein